MSFLKKLKEKLQSKPSLEIQQEVTRGLTTAKIHRLLDENKISKAELAEKLGISKAAVSAYLSGERNFTLDTLTHIAYVFDQAPKIDFVPLDAKHEATLYVLSASPNVTTHVDRKEIETSSYKVNIASAVK